MKYRLGIDLGSTSLGWCVLELDENNDIKRAVNAGVRIFSDGRNEKDHTPLAVIRREARGIRINRDRYKKRRARLLSLFIENGLMPKDEKERKKLQLLNPYELRAKGIKNKISLYELGRALFHINQRRGFKSNRKSDGRQKDEKGKIKDAADRLKKELKERGYETIGEFFYSRLQKGETTRVRLTEKGYEIYPLREMYEHEVETLLNFQKKYHKELNDKLIKEIQYTIFFQRDLKPQEPGFCEFEEGKKRLAKAHPLFQEFRIEQEVNNLETDGKTGEYLSFEQRQKIKDILNSCKIKPNKSNMEISFASIKKAIGLPKNAKFNYESEKRKGLKCNTTNYYLSDEDAFGADWFNMAEEERFKVAEMITSSAKDYEVIEWLKKNYKLAEEKAANITDAFLEEGYGSLSKEAIIKILPYLKEGLLYPDACEKAGYHHSDRRPKKILEQLPYYGEVMPNKVIGGTKNPADKNNPEKYFGKINNPSVHIALNQLRKVVNALIKKYGHPEQIAFELARELKSGTKGLKELEKEQVKNQKENEKIDKILKENGLPCNSENRLRYKLWEELGEKPVDRRCVFTGKQISFKDIWSDKFEIEHLLPFSRTYDDSRSNKTLSSREANRIKGNRTPYEAFGESKEWEEIMKRVQKLPENKRWRFSKDAMQKYEKDGGPIARLLNDTRYMSRVGKEYLSHICDADQVYAIPGQLTGLLRGVWGLNSMKEKSDSEIYRADHRHHAIDAFVVGCTTRGMLKTASECADWAEKAGGEYEGRRKLLKKKFLPFASFEGKGREEFEKIVENIVVSYKPDHKGAEKAVKIHSTTGALHQETAYGPAKVKAKKKGCIAVTNRIDIKSVEEKDLENIADKNIAKALAKILKIEDKEKKAQALEKFSKENKIKKVKCILEKDEDVMIPIYKTNKNGKKEEKPYKYYQGGNNYCMDIYCLRPDDKKYPKDAGKWKGEVISNFSVHQPDFQPQWRKIHPTAKRVMRLFINDTVCLTFNRNEPEDEIPMGLKSFVSDAFAKNTGKEINMLFRVKKMSGSRVYLRPSFVSKEEGDKLSWGPSAQGLFERKARKVYVNEIGEYKDPGFVDVWEKKK